MIFYEIICSYVNINLTFLENEMQSMPIYFRRYCVSDKVLFTMNKSILESNMGSALAGIYVDYKVTDLCIAWRFFNT